MRTFGPLMVIIPVLLIDLLVFFQLRSVLKIKKRLLHSAFFWFYWIMSLGLLTGILISFSAYQREPEDMRLFQQIMSYNAVFITVFVFKLVFALFSLIALFAEWFAALWSRSQQTSAVSRKARPISRGDFIRKTGMLVSMIPVIGIIHGIGWGRFNFTLHRHRIQIPDLPPAFDGFKIVQLSDAHLGSLAGQQERLAQVFDQINDLNPDVLVFTGDMVNNFAHEISGWVPVWKKLKAPYGKFSVLGNHDYGNYSSWPSDNARRKNLQEIIRQEREMGFDLLLNESRVIEKDGEQLTFIGVENWGSPPFPQYGDLQKAMDQTDTTGVHILLSHDPDHFEHQVKGLTGVDLTLSGHTHGFQFGIEIGKLKLSPVQLKYKRWAGLYQEGDQYLYVNRGLGYLAFPGRVGIWPEITLLELVR